MQLMPGQSFGPYRLVQPAGAGGMADVWRAHDARLDRYVAIKFLAPRFAENLTYLDRFRREARAISRLDHPNILTILEFGEQDGWTYMVSPFIGGGTLTRRLRRGPWTVAEALEVLDPLASALDYAHSMGIVHRDVKPSNVLFTEQGRLVLSDFGVARMLEANTMLSQAGLIIGTPTYMSPEQAEGQPAGPASDIYSFGVVAYELLTGVPPFQAETPVAMLRAHVDRPLPPPRSLNPVLSDRGQAALYRVLAKQPNDRYALAADFVAALRPEAGAATTYALDRPEDAPITGEHGASTPQPSARVQPVPGPPYSGQPRYPPPPLAAAPGSAAMPAAASPWGAAGSLATSRPRRRGMVIGLIAVGASVLAVSWLLGLGPWPGRGSTEQPSAQPGATPTIQQAAVIPSPTPTPTQPPTATPSPPTATATMPPTPTVPPPTPTVPPPSVTPVRQPAEAPVVFAESFDLPARGQLTATSHEPDQYALTYEGGEYRIRSIDPSWSGALTVPLPSLPADTLMSVDARLEGEVEDRSIILSCRVQDRVTLAGYDLTVSPGNGAVLLHRTDREGGVNLSGGVHPAIRRGAATNRIALLCQGRTISGYVNGIRVVTAQDDTYGVGQLRIGAGLRHPLQGSLDARFDNLTVSTPP